MMIMLLFYTLIFSIIIYKGFYKSMFFIKSSSVRKNTEIVSTSIQIESLPFFFNQGKIHLFAIFINFILISFISLTFLPEFFLNHMTYCQDAGGEIPPNSDNRLSLNSNSSNDSWLDYVYDKSDSFTQKLIDIQDEKTRFNIRQEHNPSEYINALTELQNQRVELRSILISFHREQFPVKEILECSKQLSVSIETDRMEINFVKQVILGKPVENKDSYLRQIDILINNNNRLQRDLDGTVNRLLSSLSEEKKND